MIMTLMPVVAMMAACLARVFQLTFEISLNYIHHRTAATSYYLDSARRQFVEGTHTHIAGKHKCHAVFLKTVCYVRLATASFRRRHDFCFCNFIIIIDSYNRVERTMSEMVVNIAISCR